MSLNSKALYTVFCLAVLLFVAKPFLGFAIISSGAGRVQTHNILVKSFTKRKPEDFRDAEARKIAIQRILTNPPLPFILCITALLGLLFPAIFKCAGRCSAAYLNNLRLNLIPSAPSFLLNGKLTI